MRAFALLILLAGTSAALPVSLAGPWKLKLDDNLRWAQPGIDDSAWPTVVLPRRRPRAERSYWLRRTIPTPAATGELEMAIGLVSESYELYVNGLRIGGTGDFGKTNLHFFRPRSFPLPPEVFRSGSLVLALRIWNTNIA